jgi:hypothetical protein
MVSKTDLDKLADRHLDPAHRQIETRFDAAMSAVGPDNAEARARLIHTRGVSDLALARLASDLTAEAAVSAAKAREIVRTALADKLRQATENNPVPDLDEAEIGKTLAKRLDAAMAAATADREKIVAAFDARVAAQKAALGKQVEAEALERALLERMSAIRRAAGTAVEEVSDEWLKLESEARRQIEDGYRTRCEPRVAEIIGELDQELSKTVEASRPAAPQTQPIWAPTPPEQQNQQPWSGGQTGQQPQVQRQTYRPTPDVMDDIVDAEVLEEYEASPFNALIRTQDGNSVSQALIPASQVDQLPVELRVLLAQQLAANQPSRWPTIAIAAGVGAVVVSLVLALVLWLGGGLSIFDKPDPMEDVKAPAPTSQTMPDGAAGSTAPDVLAKTFEAGAKALI